MPGFLREYRCKYCNKLFFKGDLVHCIIEIKCKNCKKFNEIRELNCNFLLFFDQNNSHANSDGSLLPKEAATKAIAQCPNCRNAEYCGYYKTIKDGDSFQKSRNLTGKELC